MKGTKFKIDFLCIVAGHTTVDKTISFGRWNHLTCCWNVQNISKTYFKKSHKFPMPDHFPYFLAKSPFRFTLDTPTPVHFADLAEGAPCRQMVLGRCLVFIPMIHWSSTFSMTIHIWSLLSLSWILFLWWLWFSNFSHFCCLTLNHDFQLRWFRSLFLLLKSLGNHHWGRNSTLQVALDPEEQGQARLGKGGFAQESGNLLEFKTWDTKTNVD